MQNVIKKLINKIKSHKNTSTDTSTELSFLKGEGKSDNGYEIEDILTWGKDKLESSHDYIQRVFPLNAASVADDSAPILTDEEIVLIKKAPQAISNIHKMYETMLKFYKLDGDKYKDWTFSRHWNYKNDHNFLRLSRMLKCFRLLNMTEEYEDLVMRLFYPIDNNISEFKASSTTRQIWSKIRRSDFYKSE